jgi:hypothetical protein
MSSTKNNYVLSSAGLAGVNLINPMVLGDPESRCDATYY